LYYDYYYEIIFIYLINDRQNYPYPGGGSFGISEVLMPLADFVQKPDFRSGVLRFMSDMHIDWFFIMFVYKSTPPEVTPPFVNNATATNNNDTAAASPPPSIVRDLALCGIESSTFTMADLMEYLNSPDPVTGAGESSWQWTTLENVPNPSSNQDEHDHHNHHGDNGDNGGSDAVNDDNKDKDEHDDKVKGDSDKGDSDKDDSPKDQDKDVSDEDDSDDEDDDSEDDAKGRLSLQFWNQGNVKPSRKQLAPTLLQFFTSRAAASSSSDDDSDDDDDESGDDDDDDDDANNATKR